MEFFSEVEFSNIPSTIAKHKIMNELVFNLKNDFKHLNLQSR